MQELIKISKQQVGSEEVNAVSSTQLWEALEVKTPHSKWIARRIEDLGLIVNIDFISSDKIVRREIGATTIKDYILTLDTAKHIAMAERNEKGKEVRIYFIQAEKELRKIVAQPQFNIPKTYGSALKLAGELEEKRALLEAENKELKPKAQYFDALVDTNLLTGIRDTAKEIKLGQKQFVNLLLESGYVFRNREGNLRPYIQHVPDLMQLKDVRDEKTGRSYTQLYITPKGKETFRLLFSATSQSTIFDFIEDE
jgi:phage anti-repressor protein/phage antirepressor YoqD-like protein